MFRQAWIHAAVFSLASATWLWAEPPAADKKPQTAQVVLEVPAKFPVGLETVVAGDLIGTNADASAWSIHRPGQTPLVAQRDLRTGKLWFGVKVDKSSLGKTLRYAATQVTGRPIVTIAEKTDGFQFSDRRRPVMFYQRAAKSQNGKHERAHYIHPLQSIDGAVLSQDFPSDHPHHRGVFWAWHQLWVGDRRAGDAWVNKDFAYVVKRAKIVQQGPVFATLRVTVHWLSPLVTDSAGAQQPIVEETTSIRVFRALAKTQIIDFEIALKALLPEVKIGGAENSRGYSGFTVRVKPPGDMRIVDASGLLTEDAVNQVSRWADVSGRFGDGNPVSGIGILSHPSLPEFPPKWLLRRYGMQNVVYPGRQAVALSRTKLLVLRHRLVLHGGDASAARIADQQRVYETTRFSQQQERK